MKKIFVFVLLLILVTGCTRVDNQKDYKLIVDNIMLNSSNKLNKATKGYEYYLPQGVKVNKDLDFNQELMVLGTKMYLYADIVSYHYKNFTNNEDDTNYNYYYKKISNNGNFGYIGIDKQEDNYFVKIVYNYAKIETYTKSANLASIVSYATLILDSIEYNDKLIDKFISDNNLTSNATLYNIKKPKDSESKFSQYLQEYVQEEEKITVLPEE